MPRPIKKTPRPCPRGCGRTIKQKYFKYCVRCNQQIRKEKKEAKRFQKEIKFALR